jgi:hypothetical protein
MKAQKITIVAILCCTLASASSTANDGYKVVYDGGSLPDIKSGSGMKLHIDQVRIRFTKDKGELVSIPASAVTEISYGQDVHRRVGPQSAWPSFHLVSAHSWH